VNDERSKRVVTLSKLVTRSGDDGSTGLVGGARRSKDDPQVEAYGTVDELNACLGLVAAIATPSLQAQIEQIQQRLFDLGAHLADGRENPQIQLGEAEVETLETWVVDALDGLPDLTSFVLPGGGELSARLHLARTIARRAERRVITARQQVSIDALAVRYLNRLSDLLFAWCMTRAGPNCCGGQSAGRPIAAAPDLGDGPAR
jgi:cob(I)alamin adenosyltransferase